MRVHAFCINVLKLERSIDFVTAIFGMEVSEIGELTGAAYEALFAHAGNARIAVMRFGRERVLLIEHSHPDVAELPDDPRSNDLWFQHIAIVVKDLDLACKVVLEAACTPISHGPQTIPESNKAAGGIRAFYFREPNGHPLELIWFPPGKGRPIWQTPSESLFLGIDHTALAVSDTAASLRFYGDACGMVVAGESLNEGITQEELSGVRGARVKITGLRYPNDNGPGVEFLEYLRPLGGRLWPTTLSARFTGRKMVILLVKSLDAVLEKEGGLEGMVTHRVADLPVWMGGSRGATIWDPDGHLVLVMEP